MLGRRALSSRRLQAVWPSGNITPRSCRRTITTLGSGQQGGNEDPSAYCRDLVRKRDYESFLTSQFYPTELRDAFFALRAFYIELASVQDAVSNQSIGKMRMQFWRDAVKDISDGRPPKHPVALALYDASRRANLPAYHLKRIVDARDAELFTPAHLTVDSLTAHAESTSSTFVYLLLSLLSLSSSSMLSHAASHLGVAQSIQVLLRALPYHAAKGRMVIPAEITARHGVSHEDVFRKGGDAGDRRCGVRVCDGGREWNGATKGDAGIPEWGAGLEVAVEDMAWLLQVHVLICGAGLSEICCLDTVLFSKASDATQTSATDAEFGGRLEVRFTRCKQRQRWQIDLLTHQKPPSPFFALPPLRCRAAAAHSLCERIRA
ncbi:NADH dehydrogenase (ubiquinone) complex I, assembly factor 6 [Grifola frondosa]|uniref:15-cis-phytoene synthase n=1 Tax=Grifola frondosa TaxID=5627 RepID=A0A1C7M4G4_GRIFR|nr:NADH dehydrogenase (ubiquinone) complex I, assembly factor 6 [Grifola frondosa]